MKFNNLASGIRAAAALCALGLTLGSGTARAQGQTTAPATSKENKSPDSARGAAIFKVPKDYMATDKTDLGPMVMLHPKKPAVLFVVYPKQGETTDSLRQRVRAMAASMFFQGKTADLEWGMKQLQSHPGDGDGKASIATTARDDREVQVVVYERTTGVRPFLYGYFGMRHKSGKGDNAKFIDEQGKGVKEFDELWKSFPN